MTSTFIGAHIKKESGSLLKTIKTMQTNGGNALQLFVSNPRSASLPNMETYQGMADEIRAYCEAANFKLVIHSSYTINLANEPKIGKKTMELKDCYWINLLMHELIVSDMIGAAGVVVHVGKHTKQTLEEGMKHMYLAMKYIVDQMHKLKMKSKLILETPAGAGTELLKTVEEFVSFFNKFSETDKKHLGICIDTAHIWSSGYNVSDYLDVICKTNSRDITVIHLNNSKKEQGSCADAHEFILEKSGKIPINDLGMFLKKLSTFKLLPMIILETPSDDVSKEIAWTIANIRS
jgi:deoxyribonuclease-4